MSLHLVVGAGPVGSATALLLAESGEQVRVVTRSGSGPQHPSIERVSADAADAERLAVLASGAVALYNCANPPYHRWPLDWPPLAASVLEAATRADAVLVTCSNLYGYGPLDHPMTEGDAQAATSRKGRVRAQMWRDCLAAHEAGRVRVAEARASDFMGRGAGADTHLGRVVPRVVAGKAVRVLGDPDAPHSYTAIDDVARCLVVLGADERAWGRAWHVPSPPALTQRATIERLAELAGAPRPRVGRIPGWVLGTAGVVVPMLRELDEIRYQFERPFVIDASAFSATFAMAPTPLDDALAAMAEAQMLHALPTGR